MIALWFIGGAVSGFIFAFLLIGAWLFLRSSGD